MTAPFAATALAPLLNFPAPAILYHGRGGPESGLIMDGFAGGGGASEAFKMATGRDPDFAWNHDEEALCMHAVNHPGTKHFCQNIWQADFAGASGGEPVWQAWFSPDCKHHSKAKGDIPLERNIRDLAWVILRAIHELGRMKPKIIYLENVEEFQDWGPLALGADGQWSIDKAQKGATFRKFIRELRRNGYVVEWRETRACDFGAPTIRKRLFLVARCDGEPIRWGEPTHGAGLLPYRTAAECIDWSLRCPSIFLTPEEAKEIRVRRPLADTTMRRIAQGVKRFVIDAAEPFIVTCNHSGDGFRGQGTNEPFKTITGAHDAHGLVIPSLSRFYTKSAGYPIDEPAATASTHDHTALVAAFLAQHNTDMVGHHARKPLSTIVGKGCTQAVVASNLVKLRGSCRDGQPTDRASPTITANGFHIAEVRSFLVKYYGSAVGQPAGDPLHSVTTLPRFGLVTVEGEPYEIVDIGMRMLTPRELFRCQGFPDSYIIDPIFKDGRPLSKKAQNKCCGNSVSPPPAEALIRANIGDAFAPRSIVPAQAAE